MATLTRPKTSRAAVSSDFLTSSIPTPFPSGPDRERLLRERFLEDLTTTDVPRHNTLPDQAGPSRIAVEAPVAESDNATDVRHELMPSIAYVQKSCIMTLNNLLSGSDRWNPIVPDRRHSMPSSPQSPASDDIVQSSSALQTLVTNLRNRSPDVMIETRPVNDSTELIHELRMHVENMAPTLEPDDAHLAQSLVSLLSHFRRLSTVSDSRDWTAVSATWSPHDIAPVDLLDTLKRQLSDLQVERLTTHQESYKPGSPPVLAVETALLWSRIDEELETVVSMCKDRTEGLPRFSATDHLPPQYNPSDYQTDTPPEYDHGSRVSVEDSKTSQAVRATAGTHELSEKMRLDLEAVSMAIDRLYLVAPQLHNQRVELKSTKLEQMEKARRAGSEPSAKASSSTAVNKQKGKEKDVYELENLLDLLGRASERTFKDQSVIIQGGMTAQLEKARLRDRVKRDAFVEQLVQHSDAGRYHSQDATFQSQKAKDPQVMLTLPEFIRESVPAYIQTKDSEALLTLPEFVKEPPPERVASTTSITRLRGKKSVRSRSLSAPGLSWLRPSTSKASGLSSPKSRPGTSDGSQSTATVAFDVTYVSENHENLQHILVFLNITGATPGVDVTAEVLPFGSGTDEGDRLIVRSGPSTSPPLLLPGRTSAGKKDIAVQSGHFEIKLLTSSNPDLVSGTVSIPLLDASQLSNSSPTSFICASCSLPLVQSSKIDKYRDLPSEHWEELVDAWMCHTDQNLHEQVQKHSRGFWPEQGQALVGGSYILFEESAIVKNNTFPTNEVKRGEDWSLVRCLCGAVAGRCQKYYSEGTQGPTVYRLLKFAIRPVSPTAEPFKIPLSAFVVEDMIEFVQAHATYRFVILDEEEERPRLLIWLFKPSIRLAYMRSKQYTLPKSGSIHAAKVLFKILGPSTSSLDLKSILGKYPGFPQAEYLFYPMGACQNLARLLKESNSTYPESMRTMTGLDVGWLHRV